MALIAEQDILNDYQAHVTHRKFFPMKGKIETLWVNWLLWIGTQLIQTDKNQKQNKTMFFSQLISFAFHFPSLKLETLSNQEIYI